MGINKSGLGHLLSALLMFSVSLVAVAEHEDLSGPAFTDPSVMVKMPDEWKKQPISRVKWAEGADIAVTLDQHLYPALLPTIKKYALEHDLDIAVQEGTCGISAGNLTDKTADIGGFCCPAGETDRLPGLKFHTLAIAPIALMVHPTNPVDNISLESARKVFMGRITSWSELDDSFKGDPRQSLIRAVGRLHCKARPGHWRLLLDNDDLFSPRLTEVSTIPDMITAVAENRGAIGYGMLWMAERFSDLGQVKVLSLDGVDPRDNDRVVDGDYPLYRVFNITTWTTPETRNEKADALVAHLKSSMNSVDPKYGLIPYTRLQEAGWSFDDGELTGAPK